MEQKKETDQKKQKRLHSKKIFKKLAGMLWFFLLLRKAIIQKIETYTSERRINCRIIKKIYLWSILPFGKLIYLLGKTIINLTVPLCHLIYTNIIFF